MDSDEGECDQGQQQNQEATSGTEEFRGKDPFLCVDEMKGTMDKGRMSGTILILLSTHLLEVLGSSQFKT